MVVDAGGCVMAVLTVSCLLAAVVTCGVTVSAICNSTVLGIAVLWIVLYGGGFALTLLPAHYPSPSRALGLLPEILKGYYDSQDLTRLMGWSVLLSLALSVVGLAHFARRDI